MRRMERGGLFTIERAWARGHRRQRRKPPSAAALRAAAGSALIALACALAPPAGTAATPAPAGQHARVVLLRYSAPVPDAWQPQPPSSGFRLAQFRVPGSGGTADAEAIVFHFGQGQGGSAAANIARWASQFSAADGRPVVPKVETFTVERMPATLVELTGRYARGIGAGPVAQATPDQTLLATVVEAPEGNLIFQLHGPRATVEQHRAGFVAMVKGVKAR
jgi:hypothetical protein